MSTWKFDPASYVESAFTIIPVGDHRVRIVDVAEKNFNSGNDGFEITFSVNGYSSKIWFYLVLDRNDPKKTNQRIGDFFNSFAIADYDLSHYRNWIGKVGAVRVKHEDYNGTTSAKVAFVINRKNQDKLEPWKEVGGTTAPAGVSVSRDDLPF